MAVAFGPTSCFTSLCLRASSCTVLKPSMVLFQNTAFMVAKTSPFGLKNRFSQLFSAKDLQKISKRCIFATQKNLKKV